jgi:hypothetical protein
MILLYYFFKIFFIKYNYRISWYYRIVYTIIKYMHKLVYPIILFFKYSTIILIKSNIFMYTLYLYKFLFYVDIYILNRFIKFIKLITVKSTIVFFYNILYYLGFFSRSSLDHFLDKLRHTLYYRPTFMRSAFFYVVITWVVILIFSISYYVYLYFLPNFVLSKSNQLFFINTFSFTELYTSCFNRKYNFFFKDFYQIWFDYNLDNLFNMEYILEYEMYKIYNWHQCYFGINFQEWFEHEISRNFINFSICIYTYTYYMYTYVYINYILTYIIHSILYLYILYMHILCSLLNCIDNNIDVPFLLNYLYLYKYLFHNSLFLSNFFDKINFIPEYTYYYSHNCYIFFKFLFNIHTDVSISIADISYFSYLGEFYKQDNIILDVFYSEEYFRSIWFGLAKLTCKVENNFNCLNYYIADNININFNLITLANYCFKISSQVFVYLDSWF